MENSRLVRTKFDSDQHFYFTHNELHFVPQTQNYVLQSIVVHNQITAAARQLLPVDGIDIDILAIAIHKQLWTADGHTLESRTNNHLNRAIHLLSSTFTYFLSPGR
jgi:hypothetical protein